MKKHMVTHKAKRWLCNLFLTVLFAAATSAHSQPAVQAFDHEITTLMLEWNSIEDGKFPALKSRALSAWRKDFGALDNLYYANVDLNNDGRLELVVTDLNFPTRGRGFLFLQKQRGDWVNVAAFRGGFILTRDDVKKYFNIQIFEKEYGEMYFYELGFKGGKYRLLFETKLARTIYDAEFYEKWKFLNDFEFKKTDFRR
jgi:hypothetical protein